MLTESFALSQLNRLLNAAKPNREGKTDEVTANALIAAVEGIRPENEVEGMLAVEMAVTHHLGLEALHHLRGAQPQYQVYGNVASKLLRTYTAQVEALARLRRKGEQKVRVEHVHVHPGGQAIVGAVGTGGASDNRVHPGGQAIVGAVGTEGASDNQRQPHSKKEKAAKGRPRGAQTTGVRRPDKQRLRRQIRQTCSGRDTVGSSFTTSASSAFSGFCSRYRRSKESE